MNTLVNFETAKLLKEKGFDITTKILYNDEGYKLNNGYYPDIHKDDIACPTITDVVMWLYEKHGIWISVLQMLNNGETVTWYASYYEQGVGEDIEVYYNSPTEAYEAAIEYTLKNLI